MKLLEYKSESLEELIDITDDIKQYVKDSGIDNGTLTIQTINNTCSIVALSTQFGDVSKNFYITMNKLYPLMDGMKFMGNDIKCIRSGIVGSSKTFIVAGGEPVLGPFENIYLAEFDGPSDRLVVVLEITQIDESLDIDNNPALAVAEFRAEYIEAQERKKIEDEKAVIEMREEWAKEHADDPRFQEILNKNYDEVKEEEEAKESPGDTEETKKEE